MEEIRDQSVYLICLTAYGSRSFFFRVGVCGQFHHIGHSLDRSNGGLDIVGQFGNQFLPAPNRCLLTFPGRLQLLPHDIEGFRELTEDVAPVHFKGCIQVAGCDAPCKALHLRKRPYNITVHIELVCGYQHKGDEKESRNGHGSLCIICSYLILHGIMNQQDPDCFPVLPDITYHVIVSGC